MREANRHTLMGTRVNSVMPSKKVEEKKDKSYQVSTRDFVVQMLIVDYDLSIGRSIELADIADGIVDWQGDLGRVRQFLRNHFKDSEIRALVMRELKRMYNS